MDLNVLKTCPKLGEKVRKGAFRLECREPSISRYLDDYWSLCKDDNQWCQRHRLTSASG